LARLRSEMNGVGSLDRLRTRTAVVGSFIAGALAIYWLVEILRDQVPEVGAHDIKITIALLSVVALAFGLVARRSSGRITIAPMILAPWAAAWAVHLVSDGHHLPQHDLGAPGIATLAVTFGLMAAGALVREPRRRSIDSGPRSDPDRG
jgi:hypothetical protein